MTAPFTSIDLSHNQLSVLSEVLLKDLSSMTGVFLTLSDNQFSAEEQALIKSGLPNLFIYF